MSLHTFIPFVCLSCTWLWWARSLSQEARGERLPGQESTALQRSPFLHDSIKVATMMNLYNRGIESYTSTRLGIRRKKTRWDSMMSIIWKWTVRAWTCPTSKNQSKWPLFRSSELTSWSNSDTCCQSRAMTGRGTFGSTFFQKSLRIPKSVKSLHFPVSHYTLPVMWHTNSTLRYNTHSVLPPKYRTEALNEPERTWH